MAQETEKDAGVIIMKHDQKHSSASTHNCTCRTLSPRGTQKWYSCGVLHRQNDHPAIVRSNGDEEWWTEGKKHRDNDLPADVRADGTLKWYVNGLLHRTDGPAVKYPDGTFIWYEYGKILKYYCGRRKEYLECD